MAPMKCPAQPDLDGDDAQTWSLTHLARRWKVSRRAVRKLLVRRLLPFEQINGQLRVPVVAVREFEIAARKARGKLRPMSAP